MFLSGFFILDVGEMHFAVQPIHVGTIKKKKKNCCKAEKLTRAAEAHSKKQESEVEHCFRFT